MEEFHSAGNERKEETVRRRGKRAHWPKAGAGKKQKDWLEEGLTLLVGLAGIQPAASLEIPVEIFEGFFFACSVASLVHFDSAFSAPTTSIISFDF